MTTHRFSRRAMLRGIGVSMALPWFESLNVWGDEAPGNRKASEAPVRLAVLFSGNGFHGKEWWAKGEGNGMELGRVQQPLPFHSRPVKNLTESQFQRGQVDEEVRPICRGAFILIFLRARLGQVTWEMRRQVIQRVAPRGILL